MKPHHNAYLAASTLAAMTVLVSLTGCDSDPEATVDAAGADAASTGTFVAWSSSTTTTAIPAYDKSCRYAAESIFEVPSDGANDRLVINAATGSASLELGVNTADGNRLDATVTLQRGLAEKSWRGATGTATWDGGNVGNVVDGAVCFSEKLAQGQDAVGELTLVIEDSTGSHTSVSGGFSIKGADVRPSTDVAIAAEALDIDLR